MHTIMENTGDCGTELASVQANSLIYHKPANLHHTLTLLLENISLNVQRWFSVTSVCVGIGGISLCILTGRPCLCKPSLLQHTICDN